MLKKLPPFIFFLLVAPLAFALNQEGYKLPVLREEYRSASLDGEVAERFNKKMQKYKGEDPSVLAYKAASEAVMAKYVWNPYSKLKQLKTAAAIFEDAVEQDKDNPEIRFLRFTVEYYVPRYLNLSPNIEDDKKIVIEALKEHPKSGLPAELARTMLDFMLSKDHLTPAEKKALQQIDI